MQKHKILCLLMLIVIIAVSVIPSCSNTNESDRNIPNNGGNVNDDADAEFSDNASEDRSALDDLGAYDFGGYDFKICHQFEVTASADYRLDFEELTGDVYRDEVFMRNRNIEDRFNIEIITFGGRDPSDMRTSMLAGSNDYDAYFLRADFLFTYASEGLLYSVNDFEHINLSKKYWDDYITNQLTVMNEKYFAVGALNFSVLDLTSVLVFNKQMVQEYGLENPFESVKNGNWTYDKFTEMCKAATLDLDGDGVMTGSDSWGFVSRSNDVLPSLWISAGVTATEKDNDDVPQNTMGTEKFINVIDKIFDMTWGSGTYFSSDLPDMFLSGNVLFNASSPFRLQSLRGMETDFGILPFPKLNEQQENYNSRIGGGIFFCVGKSASKEELDRAGIILESMACESLKTCVPAYYDLMLKTKLARDVESEEIIDIIFSHRVLDWIDNVWTAEIRDGPLHDMFNRKNNTIVSLNESRLDRLFTEKRDKMVEAFLLLSE